MIINRPQIDDFTESTHDHSSNDKGGKLPISSISGIEIGGSGELSENQILVYGYGYGYLEWTNVDALDYFSLFSSEQNIWSSFSSDSGSVTSTSPNDNLTITGSGGVSTSIVGKTLSIASAPGYNVTENNIPKVDATGQLTDSLLNESGADIVSSGNIIPDTDSSYNLGSTTTHFSNIFTDKISVTYNNLGTQATSRGSIIFGYNMISGSAVAADSGSIAGGFFDGVSGSIQTGLPGSLAIGAIVGTGGSIANNGYGSFSMGTVSGAKRIYSGGGGGGGAGAFAFGYSAGGDIEAIGKGAVSIGFSQGGDIIASNSGSFAFGQTANAYTITSSGNGSIAFGFAPDGNITSSGFGSGAFGYAGGTDIIASGDNSFQFGYGTNSTACSLQVGGNIKILGLSTIASNDGEITKDASGNVLIHSGGSSINVSSLQTSPTPPGGSNTQIQFNSSGSFAGDASLTWNSTSKTLNTENLTAIVTSNGDFTTDNGSIVFGKGISSQCYITANNSSIAGGYAGDYTGSSHSFIRALGPGSSAIGFVYGVGLSQSGVLETQLSAKGSSASGYVSGNNSKIYAVASGSQVFGHVGRYGVIKTGASGSLSFGHCNNPTFSNTATIQTSGAGSFSFGKVVSELNNISITSSGEGALSGGYLSGYTTGITASGTGSIAFGKSFAGSIQSSGDGSMAIGNATDNIWATADSSFQFGAGVNSTSDSLQVGGNIKILGSATSTSANGQITKDLSNNVLIHSGSVSRNVTTAASKSVSFVIFDSDVSVAVGNGKHAFSVPASMNGMVLTDALATVHTIGITNSTTIQIRRRRLGSEVYMLSDVAPITISTGYYSGSVLVLGSNDNIATGDQIYIDVNTIHTGTAPLGLSVVLTFEEE